MISSLTGWSPSKMMRFWLDIMTPKQVWLFESIKRSLEARGHKTIVTTRTHDVVVDLLKLKKIPHYVAGKYGGETLEGKLRTSTERVLKLIDFVSPLSKEIDFSIHFSSPEAARVAFGLGIKAICLNDTPHSTAVCKLTFPFSNHVVSPACIDPSKLVALGASKDSIVQYDGVDEIAWIPNLKPDSTVLRTLGLSESSLLVVIRPEEAKAAYLHDFKDISSLNFQAAPLVKKILEEFKDAQVVVIPRYEDQRAAILKEFHGKVIVPRQVIDGPSLLAFSTLTVSGGGTMCWESALLGVPSISHFPLEMDVERYLTTKGFPIYYSKNLSEVTSHALTVLRDPDKYRVDTKELTRDMESPNDAIDRILTGHT
jgi:predicted glycosyltransferase